MAFLVFYSKGKDKDRQITNSIKNNPGRKSSVCENIIDFSNETNILTFFQKVF